MEIFVCSFILFYLGWLNNSLGRTAFELLKQREEMREKNYPWVQTLLATIQWIYFFLESCHHLFFGVLTYIRFYANSFLVHTRNILLIIKSLEKIQPDLTWPKKGMGYGILKFLSELKYAHQRFMSLNCYWWLFSTQRHWEEGLSLSAMQHTKPFKNNELQNVDSELQFSLGLGCAYLSATEFFSSCKYLYVWNMNDEEPVL